MYFKHPQGGIMELSKTVDQVLKELSPILNEDSVELVKKFLIENGQKLMEMEMESLPTKEEVEAMIQKVMEKSRPHLDKEQQETLKKILEDVYLRGKSFGEAFNLSHQNLEDIYNMGYTAYNAGHYQEAQNFFCFLTLMDREEPRYFFGAGAAFQMLKDYPNAIAFYECCTILDFLNPLPWYHLSDCYLQEDKKLEAAFALTNTISRAKNNPIYRKIQLRSQMMLDKLIEEDKNII